jgi:hypothetical protein
MYNSKCSYIDYEDNEQHGMWLKWVSILQKHEMSVVYFYLQVYNTVLIIDY